MYGMSIYARIVSSSTYKICRLHLIVVDMQPMWVHLGRLLVIVVVAVVVVAAVAVAAVVVVVAADMH